MQEILSMFCVAVQIRAYHLDPQPGWVECAFNDVEGREWQFHQKIAYLYCGDLSQRSILPQPGLVPCKVVTRLDSIGGQEAIEIETVAPWEFESVEGQTRFTIRPELLWEIRVGVPLESPSNWTSRETA
jgi:hypothetical protein